MIICFFYLKFCNYLYQNYWFNSSTMLEQCCTLTCLLKNTSCINYIIVWNVRTFCHFSLKKKKNTFIYKCFRLFTNIPLIMNNLNEKLWPFKEGSCFQKFPTYNLPSTFSKDRFTWKVRFVKNTRISFRKSHWDQIVTSAYWPNGRNFSRPWAEEGNYQKLWGFFETKCETKERTFYCTAFKVLLRRNFLINEFNYNSNLNFFFY